MEGLEKLGGPGRLGRYGLALVLALVGCGPAREARPAAGDVGLSGGVGSIEAMEDEILRDLATIDRRFALRAHITPSEDDLRRVAMGAVLREDATVAIVDGSVDPFSFEVRARALNAASEKIAGLPKDIVPKQLVSQPPTTERELLSRLVAAELVRLEEERALPRSASSLVRAIVDTWTPPKNEREVADDDRYLARRLADVRAAMTSQPAGLDVVRARELDDALDAVEHIASGFTLATQELVKVREALEAVGSKPAAKAESDWSIIALRAKAHLGLTTRPDELAQSFEATEVDLRKRAENAVLAAKLGRDVLAASLDKNVFVSGSCVDAVPGSRVRSMAAPPEREAACHLRHLVANAEDDAARASALAALHDHLVIASWALDVARGAATIAQAQNKHHLLLPVLPDTRARYERIALARPVAAIAAGEAARILVNADDLKKRAQQWSGLGDAPLDVASRELGGR